MVLPPQRLAKMARGILDRADHTTLARVLAEAPWREAEINRRRSRDLRPQTTSQRQRRRESRVVLDETRCEPVGRLLDDVARHDHHGDGPDPPAHHPVTSVYVSGSGRCPRGLAPRSPR
jgi:hypothetical protein